MSLGRKQRIDNGAWLDAVATGDDGKRYCDAPRPTRRGLADPEKRIVTNGKIGHFVTQS